MSSADAVAASPPIARKAGLGVLIAACVSALVVNANTSAVTILLPAISEDLGTPVAQLQWAVTGYMLVGAAVIVTSGALGDVLGRRRIFMVGLVLFVASCALIALSTSGAGVIVGRMIQGAAGSTILACGMSLLSVESSGAAQMKAITLWGGASAAGAAAGPLVGGVLVELSGWQGLFWIDAAIAAACLPLTYFTVRESRDTTRSHSIDFLGTIMIAVILVPLILALSEGTKWGWASLATLGCFAISVLGAIGFVTVEKRVKAPLVDLRLLRNPVLVGATLAILIVAGVIGALMYLLSLYFQNPGAFGFSALEAGLATLPAAAAMIVITPFITPLAVKIGAGRAVAVGFILATVGSGILIFVHSSWGYGSFVLPLILIAVGLGIANGPASSASTSSVEARDTGAASGISNMARYVGGSLAVAAAATIYDGSTNNHLASGASQADALAAGLSRASILLTLFSAAGILLLFLMKRYRQRAPRPVDRAAAAASTTHTIPVPS